jgi:ATP-dependent Clp protease ATP-binding subunit ClpX
MEGCQLEYTEGALKLVAQRALKRDTGARALRSVMEEIMLELMYQLPDLQERGKYVITEEVVKGEVGLFDQRPIPIKESA